MDAPIAFITPLCLDPKRGADLLARLKATGYKHADILERAFATTPTYNLDHAQYIVEREERELELRQNRGKVITDDPHKRTDEGFMSAFARWANIHRNWPAVLLKPHEFEAWKVYYFREIDLCNQNGLYLSEVLKWEYHMDTVPEWLRKRVSHFTMFGEVDLAMLIKCRWYRFTMSRFHKPGRLEQIEQEFKQAIQQ